MDYTAVGDTTNVAARLQQAADPGRIVISEAIHRSALGYFHTRPLGELSLKGKSGPVRGWEVIGARSARSRLDVEAERGLTPFVGRERELAELATCFARARIGQGQVVLVVGEAGIGKSRLLLEFRRRLGDEATWVEGRAVSFGRSMAFHPIIDLLKRNFRIEDGDPDHAIIRKIHRNVMALGADLAPIVPHLRALLSVDPGNASLAAMDPRARRAAMFDALRRLTLRAAEVRPQVVVIEDLHWMDRATEEYMVDFANSVPTSRILVILTYRAGYQHPLGEPAHHARVTLTALSNQDALAMARGVLSAQGLEAPLQSLIARRVEGHPFFLEEVVKSLRETGAIRREGDRYILAGRLDEVVVPDTIQGVIMARIDRLEEGVKRTLQTAAVIGREFGLRPLVETAEAGDTVEAHLEHLKAIELIYQKGGAPEAEYTFKHALTQDVAYESLLIQRRRHLHSVIAAALERLNPDRVDELSSVLAHHCVRSREVPQAIQYLIRAGDRAVRLYATTEATAHYTQALAEIETLPESEGRTAQWIDIVLRLCGVSGSSVEFERDVRHLAEASRRAEAAGDRRRQSQVRYWIGRTHYVLGRFRAAVEEAEAALRTADELGDAPLAALPVNLLGRLYFATSEFKKAWPILERSAAEFERLGNRIEVAMMTAGVGWTMAMVGEFDRAQAMADRGVALAEQLDHLPTLATCYQYRACTRSPRGEWLPAIHDMRRAREIAEQAHDPFRTYMTTGLLGGFLVMSGERESGLELLEQAFGAAQRLGTKLFVGVFKMYRAEAALAAGGVEEALRYCDEAIAIARETADRWAESCAHRVRGQGRGALEPPDLAGAERELTEAAELQTQLGVLPDLARTLLAQGRMLVRRGEHERGEVMLARAVSMLEAMGMRWDLDRAEASRA